VRDRRLGARDGDSRLASRDPRLGARDSIRDSRLGTRDSRIRAGDSGLATRDSARYSRLATRDSGLEIWGPGTHGLRLRIRDSRFVQAQLNIDESDTGGPLDQRPQTQGRGTGAGTPDILRACDSTRSRTSWRRQRAFPAQLTGRRTTPARRRCVRGSAARCSPPRPGRRARSHTMNCKPRRSVQRPLGKV
jgi:hypothetical protein